MSPDVILITGPTVSDVNGQVAISDKFPVLRFKPCPV